MTATDIDAHDFNTFLSVRPSSETGLEWLRNNAGPGEPGGPLGPVYYVEHRFGPDLLLGAHNAGLVVSLDGRIADVERRAEHG